MEKFGATPLSDKRCRFVAWAPFLSDLYLVLYGKDRQIVPLTRSRCGFFSAEADAKSGSQYVFRLPDGRELPDPASRFQPDGVHGASVVIDTHAFPWTDEGFVGHWPSEMVIYELHVGTFTETGTFLAAVARLKALAEVGITTVEIMPVAQFPGSRNWGYDGVYPYAAQSTYGGPAGLQQFVDAAHGCGLSVLLDVVYNHLGPEGNYLGAFGPFFSDRYRTPWGQAINYDEAYSEPVREFFLQNALYWLEEFHIDGLRLDAVHGIFDFSAHHILAELKERVAQLAAASGRRLQVIAESDLNDARLLHDRQHDGYGLDAQWSDDFHHSVHTLLTGENNGYYKDFGTIEDLEAVLRDGWRYVGQYSDFRKRVHGNSPIGLSPEHFVVCTQNHDQIGNRAVGDRLSQIVDLESLKLAAGITLLSPFVPLLFMGEEYGETHPFQYFTSHGDAALIEAVRRGRREEFAAFGWAGEVPDPQEEATFQRCILDWTVRESEPHKTLHTLYGKLIGIRKRFSLGARKPEVLREESSKVLTLEYADHLEPIVAVFNFADEATRVGLRDAVRQFRPLLSSAEFGLGNTRPESLGKNTGQELQLTRRSFVVLEAIR